MSTKDDHWMMSWIDVTDHYQHQHRSLCIIRQCYRLSADTDDYMNI